MNKTLTVITHLLLVSSMFFFTACPNRTRPSPDDTRSAFGMAPGGLAPGAATDAGFYQDPLWGEPIPDTGAGTGLTDRTAGAFGLDNQVRGLLEPVFFEFDRSAIRQGERPKVMAAAEHLRSNPQEYLLIEGHCDWRGTTEYNLGLGDRRATAVKDYLVSLGISASRIEVLSMGDLQAVQGGTEEQMARDRRAELIVIRP